MKAVTRKRLAEGKKKINKDKPIVQESLLEFFPPVSRMGGSNPSDPGWVDSVHVPVIIG